MCLRGGLYILMGWSPNRLFLTMCGECEGNESFGSFDSFRNGNNVSERGVVHTDGLVAQ